MGEIEVAIETLAVTHIPKHCDLYITFLRDSPTGINPMSVSQKIFPAQILFAYKYFIVITLEVSFDYSKMPFVRNISI